MSLAGIQIIRSGTSIRLPNQPGMAIHADPDDPSIISAHSVDNAFAIKYKS